MCENGPEREKLLAGFESFLRKHLKVGDDTEFNKWAESEAADQFRYKYPISRVSSMTDADLREVFNLMGGFYGIDKNIPDQREILSGLLDYGVKNTRTLSVGCGLAPYEIYLASEGIIKEEVVATDFSPVVLNRADEIAKKAKAPNVRFYEVKGSEIPYKEEFGQAWMIDSLHWMLSWRECLTRVSGVLINGGRLFIVYSTFSPRIEIDPMEAIRVLSEAGMNVRGLSYLEGHVGTPRTQIFAVKEQPDTNGLIVPKVF